MVSNAFLKKYINTSTPYSVLWVQLVISTVSSIIASDVDLYSLKPYCQLNDSFNEVIKPLNKHFL